MSTSKQIPNRVLIGIQARSTSTRFPRKVFELIGDRPLLKHVISSCKRAADYLNRYMPERVLANVAVLIPAGDEIRAHFYRDAFIFEGPEDDVLARYMMAASRFNSDYICRVTGDCPLIPSYLISKMIKLAVVNGYDYVSNVDPEFRTYADGHDCEVISMRLLEHIHKTATLPAEREHVTLMARTNPPEWASLGLMTGHVDHSGIKLSVDTPADLERVREEYQKVKDKIEDAEEYFGKQSVHRV
jgi:spore coat polysaccharide biosynthesis protein SpsF